MDHYSETERVIDLKDLLYRVAGKWRSIIVAAIVVAILAAAYKGVSVTHATSDEAGLAQAQTEYEAALEAYEAKGKRIRLELERLRNQAKDQQAYIEQSDLMKIDPMNEWVGSFQLYIDSKYRIDPNSSFLNVDMTSRLVSVYSGYLTSGELYDDILQELDTVKEIRFLTEIFSVSADADAATISVRCIGKSEADVRALLELVEKKTLERTESIRKTVGDHSVSLLTESLYATIDRKLSQTQEDSLQAVSEYEEAAKQKKSELAEWEKSAPSQPESKRLNVRPIIKYFILGAVVGFIVMLCWHAARYVLSSTVKTDADWAAFGVPVLGHIGTDKKKRTFQKIDALFDRLFGHRRSTTSEQDCALTANNLGAMMKAQGSNFATFVGCLEEPVADRMVRQMTNAFPDVHFAYAGNALTDSNTASNLKQTDKVFLLAENQKTRLEDVRQTMTLLKAWGKSAQGVVVLE